jgi:membrane associated rhomboid family serine protease
MLPLQDVLPSRSTPRVTLALIVALVVTGGLVLGVAHEEWRRALILSYGLSPGQPTWWSLALAPWIPSGVVDLVLHAGALWIFGDNVEDRLGPRRYLLLLGIAPVCAALFFARLVVDPGLMVVGAAPIAGVAIGAHLALLPRSRVLVLVPTGRDIDLVELPAAIVVMFWLVAGGLITGAWTASHVVPATLALQACAIVSGAVAGRLLVRRDRLQCEWWNGPAQLPPDRRRTSRDTSASSVSSASN